MAEKDVGTGGVTVISIPFFLAVSKALTDKQWGSDLARSALKAEFNQISAENITVQAYSWTLAFVFCASVVDRRCSALSVSTRLSGLHLAVSGCRCCLFRAAALGANTGLVGRSNLRATKKTPTTLQ